MTIYNDDLFNIELPKAKMLLTDIPYEFVNRESSGLRNLDKESADHKTFELDDFLNYVYPYFDTFVIFCGNEQYSEIYKFFNNKSINKEGTTRQLVWSKTNPSPMNSEYVLLSGTENAVWFKKRGTGKLPRHYIHNVYEFPRGSSKFTPTEKNHKLLKEIILDNTSEGDHIVDTCMGSGSTGLVAAELNRIFTGIEINDKFFNIAKRRLIALD